MLFMEFYDDKGMLDHNAIVTDLAELAIVAQGRTMKIAREATLTDALDLVNGWGEANGHDGMLEALTAMKEQEHTLTRPDRWAFQQVFGGMRKLFHGDEA